MGMLLLAADGVSLEAVSVSEAAKLLVLSHAYITQLLCSVSPERTPDLAMIATL